MLDLSVALLPLAEIALANFFLSWLYYSPAVPWFRTWAAFAVTQSLNTQFEGRKPSVLVINNVLYLLTYAVFGAILAVWR